MQNNLKIEFIDINKLIPAKYNPRKLSTEQYEHIKKSLQEFGFVDPIIVNKRNNVIIGGHQRVKVWSDMGNNTIPTVFLDLDEKKEKELNIRLNANSGEWDIDILSSNFEQDQIIEWGLNIDFPFGEDFEPVLDDTRLDKKKKNICPECGHEF